MSVADTIRVATFNVSLGRRGPGVLLKAIMSGKDDQVLAVVDIIQKVRPDILLLNEFDTDFANLAVIEFQKILASGENSIAYHIITRPSETKATRQVWIWMATANLASGQTHLVSGVSRAARG